MRFAIIVYETNIDARNDPAAAPAYWAAYKAYSQALLDAGVAVGGAGLEHPSVAVSLRVRGGEREVQDGPFADSKEQLGGFFLIEAPDMETALQWAARCPSVAAGGVEVRAVLPSLP